MQIVDIHPHAISHDAKRYPFDPVGGKMSVWAKERPVDAEELLAAMDAAGIEKAVIVHASTAYGYDNSYAADSAAAYPKRFAFVGAVDVTSPDAPQKLTHWVKDRGMVGFRIFAAGSTMDEGSGEWLDDPKTFPAWEKAREFNIPVCLQTRFSAIARMRNLLDRFPTVKVILDHFAHPPIDDGPPFAKAAPFFDLAKKYPNLYLKLTERNFHDLSKAKMPAQPFMQKVVETFGSGRIAWGSNFPSSEGSLTELRDLALRELAFLPEKDRQAIFRDTALTLYPGLR